MVDFVNTNDTQEQPDTLVNIDTSLQNTEVPLSPDIASTRAYKAAFAIPDKSYDDYYTAFVNGQEKSVERETAANVDAQKYKAKAAQLNDYFSKFDALPPEQQDYVRNHTDVSNLVTIKKTDPDSVFQEFYAGNYLKTLYDSAARNPDSWFNDAVAQYPKVVNDEINKGAEQVSKREFTEKYAQDIKDILDKQGWTELLGFPIPLSISSVTDFVKLATPFYNQAKQRGLVPDTDDTILLGNNLEVQTRALLSLPFDEYKAAVVPILEKMKKDNPTAAMIFAGALLGQSTEEVTMNNLQSILDPVAALGSLAGAVNTVNRLRGAIRRVVKSSANPIVGPATRLEAVGDVEQAAVKQATADTVHMLQGTLDPAKEAVESLPSNIRVVDPAETNLYRDSVQKIKELAGPEMGPLMEHIDKAVKIERVDFTSATEAQIQQIVDESIQRNFRGHENDITDYTKPYWEHETGRWMQDVVFTNGGKLFPEATAAEAYKALNGFHDAKVAEEGGGLYSVRMQVPVKEDSPGVRAIRKNNAPPEPDGIYATFKDAVTSAISRIRTPDEGLPLEQNVDRKTLIYGRNKLIDFMQNAAEDIASLASSSRFTGSAWQDFNSIVKLARDHIDPATGKPGYFFKNETELSDAYQRHIKRVPTELEQKAYSSFKKIMEYAKVLQNYSDYKNKSRLGTQTFQVSLKEADGTKTLSPKFDAIPIDHLPGGDDTALIITGGGKRGTEEVRSLNGLGPKARRDLEQAVKEGKVQVLQTTNPEAQHFLGFSKSVGKGDWVKFVVSDNVDRFNLQWGAIKESPGGFFGTEYPKYIAQADIKYDPHIQRYRYWGDKTVMPTENGGIGKDVMDQMNKVREMIKDSRSAGGSKADRLARDAAIRAEANKLPIPDFVNWFKNGKDATGKVIPARHSVGEPFHLVDKNQMVIDVDKGLPERYVKTNAKGTKVDMFRDGTKEGVYSLKVRPDFSEPRDPFDTRTIRNEQGTRANPSYTYEPAQTVDPITMMNRALTRIVNSVYMDDYKAASVEQWLSKAGSKLDIDQRFLDAAPYYYFYNEQKYLPGTPMKMRMQLDNFRYQVKQLIGEPSKVDTWLHQTAQQMADATYGGKYQIDPWWVLPGISDGARYARGIAFHNIMGVVQLPQLMLQASSVVNLVPLAGPTRAYAGVGGASLYLKAFLSRDPKVIDHMDMIASKMGMFRPGEWKEALQILDNTGFQKVGTDHVFKEVSPSVIPGMRILDLSSIFFTGGEKMNKVSAFFAAYKEFRDIKPTGAVSNRDVQNIINRADLFSGNMSISSKAMIEKGIFSFPMQFMTYPLRMAELMLGHRIDAATKAKMIATSALLYGVPASMNTWGAPVSDHINKKAQEYGYAAGKSIYADFMMQGVVSTIVALLSADNKSKVQEKDFMNIPGKFGPSGVSILKDIYDNDKGVLKIAGGATGSVLSGILDSATPFLRFASSFGDYPITSDDLTDTMASLSQTASKGKQLAYAMNYGRWLNKNEVYQGEVSKSKAFAAFVTGLQPLDVVDANTKVLTLKDEKDNQLDALKDFTKEIHRMMYNDIDGNRGQAELNIKRAKAILELSGYPHERWNQALASAKKSFDQSQVERVNWEYYFDKVNENRAPRALETGREILQRRN